MNGRLCCVGYNLCTCSSDTSFLHRRAPTHRLAPLLLALSGSPHHALDADSRCHLRLLTRLHTFLAFEAAFFTTFFVDLTTRPRALLTVLKTLCKIEGRGGGRGQSFTLHDTTMLLAGHAFPPNRGRLVIERERVFFPGPHCLLHAESLQPDIWQSTGHAFVLHRLP